MSNPVISIRGLGKRYKLGETFQRPSYETLRDKIVEVFKAPFQKGITNREKEKKAAEKYFWALKDISLDVHQGEILGVIGANGAGKTTLLRILTQITDPTEGEIRMRGRVASLLEVGTGFHPELTGRENIFMNGAVLGMGRSEIKKNFDEIVDFAEVEKFVDTPVKRYSTGMRVRLAFAVAAHLEPEILLIDEVLAVGDAAFQKKCLGKMENVAGEGRTVLFVSHNMGSINKLCEKAICLDRGKITKEGESDRVISYYLIKMTSDAANGEQTWEDGVSNNGVDELTLFAVRILNDNNQITSIVDARKPFSIEIQYKINRPLPYCRIGFLLTTLYGVVVFETYDSDNEQYVGKRDTGIYISRCVVPADLLNPGSYRISFNAGIPKVKNLASLPAVLNLDVQDTRAEGPIIDLQRKGTIRPILDWKCEEIKDAKTKAY